MSDSADLVLVVGPAPSCVGDSPDPSLVDASRRLHTRKAGGRVNWGPALAVGAIHLGALLAFWPAMFTWRAVGTALVLQLVCGFGITIGYHRLLTHRSFRCPRWVEYALAWVGCLSLQGGPIKWTATHRLHHQYSDEQQDPHTPRHGFFWSHVLWVLTYDPQFDRYALYSRYAQDLARDRGYVFLERTVALWQVALGVALYAWGGWPCVIWGVFVRLVYVWHSTWFVNSASHTWGYRNFETRDVSRNLWWVALISLGEGWHNNHHAYPRSARHGLRVWEVDLTWLAIRLMQGIGLARDVRLPGYGATRQAA